MGGAGACHGASLGFESLGTFTVRMLVGALVTFVLIIVVSLLAFWHAGCPKGGFQCRDGQCLARSRRCDNENNCSEREDEEDCMLPDNVDVKDLYFPATNTAPCRICVCPALNSLQECLLPLSPQPSLAHCRLTTHVITHSASRDVSGVNFPHSASTRVPRSYIEAPLRERRERRAIGMLNVTLDGSEERWPSSGRAAVIDMYRRKRYGKTRRTRTFLLGKKKNTSATRVILAENHEEGESTGVQAAQSGHSAYDSIKTSDTAPAGPLHDGECVARCPPPHRHHHHHHHHHDCRHHHAKGFMDSKKITLSPFRNNSLLGTKRVKFLPGVKGGVLLKGDSGSRVPFSPRRNTQHASEATHTRSAGAEEPPWESPFEVGMNKIFPSVYRHDNEDTQGTRRRRQVKDMTTSLEIDTSLQTPGNLSLDNLTSVVTSPNHTTLEEATTEESTEAQGGGGEGAAPHGPEVLPQQPGEVRDSCHCELSHLTCVGTHMRNISARIVGEMRQLTVTMDDAATLENKVLTRFTNLRTLSHTSGGLTKLPHRLFVSLHHLEHLYLTGNRIREVEEDTCLGLAVLKVFFINRNKITSFDLTCFQYTPALQDLNMAHNLLTLEGQDFPPLLHLTSLYLNNNRLVSITNTLLLQLTAVKTLDLRDNRIATIHPRALSSLTRLRHL